MDIIDEIIDREKGFVDHPDDRGGPTNYGITLETLERWRGESVEPADVRRMTEDEARRIYEQLYIVDPGYETLAEPLRSLLVDSGVQHGTGRATRWLQSALGVTADGVIGPQTLAAYDATSDHGALLLRVLSARLRYYGDIIAGNETQRVFAAGWFRRMAEVVAGLA